MTTIKFLRLFALPLRSLAIISALALVSLFMLSPEVKADINAVTPSPNSVFVPVQNSYSFQVNWQVNRTETVITSTRLVTSSSAALYVNGANIGIVAGNISGLSSLSTAATGTIFINDSITLNATQLKAIASSPAGRVQIVRTFTDTQTTLSANIAVAATGVNTQALAVSRIDLSFSNNARTEVINQGSTLQAIAEVSFTSSGILRGEWRLIDPTTSYGSQTGRVLQVIRQPLVSSGQGRIRIVSPQLPTDQSGLHLVAFFVEQDDNPIDIPILRYFVIDTEDEQELDTQPMTSFAPQDNALLDAETVFSWAAVVDAVAYQVEIFEQQATKPLTGKLVPTPILQIKLSAMSLDWLEPGGQYLWRVKALGPGGKVLAVSPKKAVHTP